MIKIFDLDRSGTIDLPGKRKREFLGSGSHSEWESEFKKLFKYINAMRTSFESFDGSRRGTLDEAQTRRALEAAQYPFVEERTFSALYQRFQRSPSERLSFELFMQLAIFLGNLRTLFTLHDLDRDGLIEINQEEFILLDCAQYRPN